MWQNWLSKPLTGRCAGRPLHRLYMRASTASSRAWSGARRPDTVRLWRKIRTVEDPAWNRRYDGLPPIEKDHGCRAVITFNNGDTLADEIDVPNAHPRGRSPFGREDYIRKFLKLGDGIV